MIQFGAGEQLEAGTKSAALGVVRCVNEPRYARLDDGAGAHDARFERNVKRCAAGSLRGIAQGPDLGVRASEAGMMAQTDDPTLADQDRTNHGIGLDGPSSLFRLGQGQIHPGKVGSAHAGGFLKAISGRSER